MEWKPWGVGTRGCWKRQASQGWRLGRPVVFQAEERTHGWIVEYEGGRWVIDGAGNES